MRAEVHLGVDGPVGWEGHPLLAGRQGDRAQEAGRPAGGEQLLRVCSFRYSLCARIAQLMGYERIITYTLASETGASLRAVGG
jgi:hypothetical protein